MARIYDTDLYIPKKSDERQKLDWFKAMEVVAKTRLVNKIKKEFLKAKTSLPLTIFLKIANYNIDLEYRKEYLYVLKRYNIESDTIIEKKEKYLSKIHRQNAKNNQIYGF
jgi:hypothetical protein